MNEKSRSARPDSAIGERNPTDVILSTASGRVGVRLAGEGHRKSAPMDSREGQDG